MRYILFFSCILLHPFFSFSQTLNVSHDKSYIRLDNYENQVDYLLIFNGLDSNTEMSFVPSSDHNFKWYTYDQAGVGSEISNQNFINPENNTGYLVDIDGVKKWIWVIDYSQYLGTINSVLLENGDNPCSTIGLKFDNGNIPELSYIGKNAVLHTLQRYLLLEYKSLTWSNGEWVDKNIQVEVDAANASLINLEAPLQDTYFTLSGDQFSKELGLDGFSVQSQLYEAIKLQLHIEHLTTTRKEKNEANNPSDSTTLSGSAPLEIQFNVQVNSDNHGVISWTISSDGTTVFSQNGDEIRYTFDKAGSYYVKAAVSNQQCSALDSLLVKVDESAIYAPNVFTPNGDGINDEFRVAYKSIVSFKCDVFNRWGKKVFSWTNPQKGWDGTVNGVPAKPGPYFYVIQAVGSEGKKYELKGDINLLRGRLQE